MNQVVYNKYTGEELFKGTPDECQNFIANYGGGWAALDIRPAKQLNNE